MKILNSIICIMMIVACFVTSCKKDDYFVGGTLHNTKVNLTTYDFLKNNDRGLFDTLIMLIDKAGIKEKINESNTTFFVPTDYAINNYVEFRTLKEQEIDPSKKWTVDSIIKYELPRFADSLDIYRIPQTLTYADLSQNGKLYNTAKQGANAVVSYERTNDPALGYNPGSSNWPQVVIFTYLFQPISEPFVAEEIPTSIGARTIVQTSGVESLTGRVNVLTNQHTLFFAK